jgi:3-oxoadipate enol-lactonase
MKAVINNHLLRFIDIGISTAPPIIFIHGFPFSHKMWAFPGGQMEALAGTNRVIAYDVRGHGESEVGSGHYTIEFFVDDLIGLMNHLNVEKAILCGLSMGGYIALRAIERHAERFTGLVLADTKSEPDPNEVKVKRAQSIKDIQENGLKLYAENYVKSVFTAESIQSKSEHVRTIQSIIERTAPAAIFGSLLALAARTDTTPSLPFIKIPTLILAGEKDVLTTPASAQAMTEKIPNSKLEIIPSAAHMSNMENPEVFNKHLVEFVSQIK